MDPQTCVVCKKVKQHARVLRCLHTVCRDCILVKTSAQNTILCMTCGKVTPAPSNGKSQLLTLPVAVYKSPVGYADGSAASKKMCVECMEDTKATSSCVQCKVAFCAVHAAGHPLSKVTWKHSVVALGDAASRTNSGNMQQVHSCAIHLSSPLISYCYSCNELLCAICQSHSPHTGHKEEILSIADAAGKNKQELARKLEADQHTGHTGSIEAGLSSVSEAITVLNERTEQVSSEIKESFNKVRLEIEKREKELLTELGELRRRDLQPLDEQRMRLSQSQNSRRAMEMMFKDCGDDVNWLRLSPWLQEALDDHTAAAKKDSIVHASSNVVYDSPDLRQIISAIQTQGRVYRELTNARPKHFGRYFQSAVPVPPADSATPPTQRYLQQEHVARDQTAPSNLPADSRNACLAAPPTRPTAVCGQSHTLRKHPVELCVPASEPSGGPCLLVSGIPSSVSQEELEMYFESKKKSGGGEVTELVCNNVDGTAAIVFESRNTLERVMERAHKLRGVSLSVSSGFKGGQQQQQKQGTASLSLTSGAAMSKYESNMVILLNIPSTANVELVEFFMKAAVPDDGDLIVKLYPENNRALITFSAPFDFDQLDKFVTMEKLHGENMVVRRVLRSYRLRVKNIDEFGDSCDDLIKYMLKATMRIDVSVDTRHGVFDIDFPSPEVAQKALATSHSLKGKTLDLYPVVAGLDYPAEEDDQQGFTGHVSATQPVELPMDPDYLLLLHRCSNIRRDFVAALAKEHAQVQSFEVSAPCLIVEPADGKTGRFGWHKTINSLASEFLKTLGKEKLTMLSDLYADITDSDVLQSMLARYSQDIVYAPCSSDHTLTLIGRIHAVECASDAVQQKILEVEKFMREQVSELVKLRLHVSAFFMHLNVLTNLCEGQKHIEAQMQDSGKNKGSIILSGSRTEVNAVIQKLMTLQQQVFEKDLVIPDHNIANLLASDFGQEYLSGVMAAEELEGIMFVGKPSGNKPPAMWIVGWSNKEQELLGVKSKLEEECLAETMQLLPHEAEATQRPPWQDLLAEVKKQHLLVAVEVKSSGKDCCIVLHGIAPHNAVVQGEIIAYLSENAILAKFLKVSSGQERFITAYLKSDIKHIKQKYSLPFVDVCDGRVSFRGNTKNAEAGEKAFTSLLRAIASDELSIDKPGIYHVFSKSDTRKALKAIETKHRVVIEMGDESFDMEGETGTYGASEVIVTATTNAGLKVKVVKGDITQHPCDAAVNVANDEMKHIGGLALAFLRAGGKSIQDECDKYRQRYGKLPAGEAFCGSAGCLKCKWLIHAVGPHYRGGSAGEETTLASAVSRSLEEAAKKSCVTVAIPVIGTDVFGYPLEDASYTILRAAVMFFNATKMGTIREVHFVDMDDRVVNTFKKLIVENFARDQVQVPSTTTPSTGVAQKSEGPVVLAIYGKTRESVRAVKEEVSSFCKHRYQSVEVKKSGIGQMNDSDHARLIQLMERFPVHVKITGNCITISGDTMSVASVRGEVLEITVEASERQRREQHAMHISKLATWKYQTIGTTISKEYDLLVNADIEDAYQLYNQQTYMYGALTKVRIPGSNRREIDFPTMKELHADRLYASVERIDHNKKDAIPPHWDKSKVSGDLFPLQPTDPEYRKVEQLFRKSSQRTIVKIERIQNEGLYLQYVAKKDAMEKKSPGKSNELQLFHGTDNTTAQKILSQGFNRSFAGKHATVGRGVYFTVNACDSEGYSSGHPLQMFQCLVLAGEYAQGSQNIVAPPVRSGVDLYDSTVDNAGGPTIYVTYHDAQTYPEHLISFQ